MNSINLARFCRPERFNKAVHALSEKRVRPTTTEKAQFFGKSTIAQEPASMSKLERVRDEINSGVSHKMGVTSNRTIKPDLSHKLPVNSIHPVQLENVIGFGVEAVVVEKGRRFLRLTETDKSKLFYLDLRKSFLEQGYEGNWLLCSASDPLFIVMAPTENLILKLKLENAPGGYYNCLGREVLEKVKFYETEKKGKFTVGEQSYEYDWSFTPESE
jgi:hypothetical protein